MLRNCDDWWYNEFNGLYYFKGEGIGLTWREVEELEDSIEEHEENKRRRLAERLEY
jgi:hypothetical protein